MAMRLAHLVPLSVGLSPANHEREAGGCESHQKRHDRKDDSLEYHDWSASWSRLGLVQVLHDGADGAKPRVAEAGAGPSNREQYSLLGS